MILPIFISVYQQNKYIQKLKPAYIKSSCLRPCIHHFLSFLLFILSRYLIYKTLINIDRNFLERVVHKKEKLIIKLLDTLMVNKGFYPVSLYQVLIS